MQPAAPLPSRHADTFPAFSLQLDVALLQGVLSYACCFLLFLFYFFSFNGPTFAQPLLLSASPSCRLIANSAFSRQRRITRILNLLLYSAVANPLHAVAFGYYCCCLFSAHYCSPHRRRRPVTPPAVHSKQLAQPRAPAKTPLHEVYPPRPPKIGPELLSSFFCRLHHRIDPLSPSRIYHTRILRPAHPFPH